MWIKALGRLLMAVLGVFAIIKVFELLNQLVVMFLMAKISETGETESWLYTAPISSLIIPGALFVVGFLLIFRPPKCLLNIIPEDSDKSEGPIVPAEMILRIVSTFIGVLFLFFAAPRLVWIAQNIIMSLSQSSNSRQHFFELGWPSIITVAVQMTAGIYFTLGAPHFVRWQLKRLEAGREKVQ